GEYFIAQLSDAARDGRNNDEVRQALAATGAEVLEFIPNNAFLVRVRPKDLHGFETSPVFSWVGAYEPAYKIHPGLGRGKLFSPARAAADTIDVVIRLHRGEPSADLERRILRDGGSVAQKEVLDDGQTVLAATVKAGSIASIAKHPEVYQIAEAPQWQNLALV